METYINRRIRDRAMVAGMPAERFMVCIGMMCFPVLIVIFDPVLALAWLPWGLIVYWVFRNMDRIARSFIYGKQFPSHLKNR